jgi:hypothetical protein
MAFESGPVPALRRTRHCAIPNSIHANPIELYSIPVIDRQMEVYRNCILEGRPAFMRRRQPEHYALALNREGRLIRKAAIEQPRLLSLFG